MQSIVSAAALLKARRDAGLKREEACAGAPCAYGTLANYEKGRHTPTTRILVSLASLYGVTVDDLLVHDDEVAS